MNNIFVIGNGESRKNIDLDTLKSKGKVYGCNALYRDFSPDVLVCVDTKMIFEVIDNGYCKDHQCSFSDWDEFPAEMYESFQIGGMTVPIKSGEEGDRFSIFGTGVGYETMYIVWLNEEKIFPFSNNESFGAGSSAIKLATEENPDKIYLLGFDIYSEDDKINNMYKDTKCYNAGDSAATSPEKWIFEMKRIFENNPNTSYVRVSDDDNNPIEWSGYPSDWSSSSDISSNPPEWSSFPNVTRIDYNQFWEELKVSEKVNG